jgi:hypothetical protein
MRCQNQFTGIGFFPVSMSTKRNMGIALSQMWTLLTIRYCFDSHDFTLLLPPRELSI